MGAIFDGAIIVYLLEQSWLRHCGSLAMFIAKYISK